MAAPTDVAEQELVVASYNEIALKGKNQRWFWQILLRNLRRALGPLGEVSIEKRENRIVLRGGEPPAVLARVLEIPGIHAAAIAQPCARELSALIETAARCTRDALGPHPHPTRFAVRVRRSDKSFPLRSPELAAAIGAELLARQPLLRVDLDEPELEVCVEVRGELNLVHASLRSGDGGLPVGTTGKAICLLSGGIDSPVAAHAALRRGLDVHYATFHAEPWVSPGALEKVRALCARLSRHQPVARLYVVPFGAIQTAVNALAPESYRTIFARRMMQRLASRVARKERAQVLITGESLGQVASQTLRNMQLIEAAAEIPVVRPLIALDKLEIIARARKLGTFAISARAEPDCCALFAPRHPALHASDTTCASGEAALPVDALIRSALDGTAIEVYADGARDERRTKPARVTRR